jgi:hypothetical protein
MTLSNASNLSYGSFRPTCCCLCLDDLPGGHPIVDLDCQMLANQPLLLLPLL